jgi:hypothetical protein
LSASSISPATVTPSPGDARCAAAVDDDIEALGAERHLDGVVEDLDAAKHAVTGIGGEFDFLGRHDFHPVRLENGQGAATSRGQAAFLTASVLSMMPMMSASFMIREVSPSSLTSVPDHLPNRTKSPALTSAQSARRFRRALATAMTSPSCGFPWHCRE